MPAMTSGRWSKNKTFAETAREVLCSGGWGGLWGRGWSWAQFHTTITSTRTSCLPHRTHRRLKAESSFDMFLCIPQTGGSQTLLHDREFLKFPMPRPYPVSIQPEPLGRAPRHHYFGGIPRGFQCALTGGNSAPDPCCSTGGLRTSQLRHAST